jgi:RNA polymerase sigma factor (sigma-70 family)
VKQGAGRELVKTSSPHRFTPRLAASSGPAPGFDAPGAGHAGDFRHVILPHLGGAYNLARYLTRDPVLSEDIVQDAVLRAFRAFGQFRGGSARAWLLTIVRNCCRTSLASASASASHGAALVLHDDGADDALDEQADPAPNPEEALQRKSDADRVRAAIEDIPEPFREAVVLRDLEELSYAEIAEVTGVPIGTVMSRLSRGRSLLADRLLSASGEASEQSRSVK